jgi:signal transduction histidine kinase
MREPDVLPRTLSLAVHELRTPVTVVAGYLRMLIREQAGPLTDKQRKMLEEAERSCTRIAGLVTEMSEMGKLESGELALSRQEFDLGGLVAELAGDMHEGNDRGVRLEVRSAERALPITGDRVRIAAAIRVLLHSALRERGEPGTIVVESSPVNAERSWGVVVIGDETQLPSLKHGAGNEPPPFQEWLGGLGLALPVARRVIEAHGGTVWSAPDGRSRAAAGLRLPTRA